MNALIPALSIAFALFTTGAGDAPPDSGEARLDQLNVRKAVSIALERNPQIQQLREKVRAEKVDRRAAVGIYNPELIYYKEGINDGEFGEETWRISQTFDFPLTSYYRWKQQDKQYSARQMQLRANKLDVIAQVKRAYTNVAYRLEALHLAEESVNLAKQLRDAAQTRFEVGESSEMDLLNARIQLARAQNNRKEAEQNYMEARYQLFNDIGLEPENQQYGISFPDTLTYKPVQISQEQVLENLAEHPKVKRHKKAQNAADYDVKKSLSGYAPDIRVDFYKQNLGGGSYDFTGFEVGVSIPLWFGFNESTEVQRSRAGRNEMRWRYDEALLQIKRDAEQAWHGYETQQQNIRRYQETIQEQSNRLLNLTQKGYRGGQMNLLQVLEAQRTYVQSQQDYYRTLRNYYHHLITLEKFLQQELVYETGEY